MKTTIISRKNLFEMQLCIQLFSGRLIFFCQIIDNFTVAQQCYNITPWQKRKSPWSNPYLSMTCMLLLLWKQKVHLYESKIIVPFTRIIRITLSQPEGIHVHDGPGIHSDQVNNGSTAIDLTSFLAYILYYYTDKSYKWCQFYVQYESCNSTNDHIHLSQRQISEHKSFHCSTLATEQNQRSYPAHSIRRTLHHPNKHCVYYITSETGYVNVSVTQLFYNGYNSWDPEFYDNENPCVEGGVTFEYNDESFQHFCNNYTANLNLKTDENYLLPNIVSSTPNGLVVVVYSFKSYSHISLKATATATQCQGVHPKYSSN